jgi:hypothetical protein
LPELQIVMISEDLFQLFHDAALSPSYPLPTSLLPLCRWISKVNSSIQLSLGLPAFYGRPMYFWFCHFGGGDAYRTFGLDGPELEFRR